MDPKTNRSKFGSLFINDDYSVLRCIRLSELVKASSWWVNRSILKTSFSRILQAVLISAASSCRSNIKVYQNLYEYIMTKHSRHFSFFLIVLPVYFLDEFVAECFPPSPIHGNIQCRDSTTFVEWCVVCPLFASRPSKLKQDSSLLFHISWRTAIPLEHIWHSTTTISFDSSAGFRSALSLSWFSFAQMRLGLFFSLEVNWTSSDTVSILLWLIVNAPQDKELYELVSVAALR